MSRVFTQFEVTGFVSFTQIHLKTDTARIISCLFSKSDLCTSNQIWTIYSLKHGYIVRKTCVLTQVSSNLSVRPLRSLDKKVYATVWVFWRCINWIKWIKSASACQSVLTTVSCWRWILTLDVITADRWSILLANLHSGCSSFVHLFLRTRIILPDKVSNCEERKEKFEKISCRLIDNDNNSLLQALIYRNAAVSLYWQCMISEIKRKGKQEFKQRYCNSWPP